MASSINASTAGVGGVITTADNSGILNLQTAGTTAVTIDASQNVGVGVTPQSWYAGTTQIEIGNRYGSIGGGIAWSSGPNLMMSTNVYLDATNTQKYIATAAASRYYQASGQHIWYNSASGTANTAVTMNEVMRINANGNLAVGTTPSSWSTSNSVQAVELLGGALWNYSTQTLSLIQNAYYSGSAYVYKTTAGATRYDQASGSHAWYIAPSGTAGTAATFTQAMALSSGGSLDVQAQINGGYYAPAAGTTAMALGTNTVTKVTPNATATFTTTVAPAGSHATIIILTSGTTSYTITFGTGFKTTGTLATGATTARYFMISFVSDGTNMLETGRTVAIA